MYASTTGGTGAGISISAMGAAVSVDRAGSAVASTGKAASGEASAGSSASGTAGSSASSNANGKGLTAAAGASISFGSAVSSGVAVSVGTAGAGATGSGWAVGAAAEAVTNTGGAATSAGGAGSASAAASTPSKSNGKSSVASGCAATGSATSSGAMGAAAAVCAVTSATSATGAAVNVGETGSVARVGYNDDEWKPSLAKEDVGPILELSKKVLGNYIKTAASHVQSDSFMWGVGMRDPKVDIVQHNKNVSKRRKGIQMAANKLTKEDVEEIDEGHGMFSARTFGWNNQSENDDKKYKIIRFHKKGGSKTIAKGVSLSYAKSHCGHSETSSSTCTGKSPKAYTRRHGEWFDGYDVDKRRR